MLDYPIGSSGEARGFLEMNLSSGVWNILFTFSQKTPKTLQTLHFHFIELVYIQIRMKFAV
jgi:hypothetical protein